MSSSNSILGLAIASVERIGLGQEICILTGSKRCPDRRASGGYRIAIIVFGGTPEVS